MSDYISRRAAEQAKCEFLNEYIDCQEKSAYAKGWNNCNSAYRNSILELPAADVRPVVRGKWIWNSENQSYYCDKCGTSAAGKDQNGEFIFEQNFCYKCGADMSGDDFNGFFQQGWQCPICKRVYSPETTMCLYCGGSSVGGAATELIVELNKPIPNSTLRDNEMLGRIMK